jgi:hypothetical protein
VSECCSFELGLRSSTRARSRSMDSAGYPLGIVQAKNWLERTWRGPTRHTHNDTNRSRGLTKLVAWDLDDETESTLVRIPARYTSTKNNHDAVWFPLPTGHTSPRGSALPPPHKKRSPITHATVHDPHFRFLNGYRNS